MQYLLLSTQEPGIRPDHPAVSPQIKTSPALPSVALHALGVETKTPYAVDLNPPTPLSPSSFPAHLKRTLTLFEGGSWSRLCPPLDDFPVLSSVRMGSMVTRML
jgi:hypothetical protein